MKKLTFAKLLTMFIIFAVTGTSAIFAGDTKEIKIQTNANKECCKTQIEDGLKGQAGILSSSLDLTTKTVTVKYDSEKTNPDNIRTAIAKIGYKADSVTPADTKACCPKDNKCKTKKGCGKSCGGH